MANDKAAPEELDYAPGPALKLIGDGVRKAMGVVVYRAAMYADAEEARKTLEGWNGHSHSSLCADQDFFNQLVAGRYRKCIRLHFAWSLGAAKVQDSFGEALLRRVPGTSAEHARAFVAAVPDVPANSVLLVKFASDGEHVEISLAGKCLNSVASHELWSGFQRIYFDEQDDLPTIKKSLVRFVPEVVFPPLSSALAAIGNSSEDCSDAELRQRIKPTWRDSSGRAEGKEGYKFGDLTRTLLQKTRKGTGANDVSHAAGNQVLNENQRAIADLSSQVKDLQKDLDAAAQKAGQERLAALCSGALVGASTALFAASAAVEVLGPAGARPLLVAAVMCLLTWTWTSSKVAKVAAKVTE
jgi:hypothetical protein